MRTDYLERHGETDQNMQVDTYDVETWNGIIICLKDDYKQNKDKG